MIDFTDWLIKPEETLVVHFGWPDHAILVRAMKWIFDRFPEKNFREVGDANYILSRNRVVRRILREPSCFTDFLFLDRDMIPGRDTDTIFKIKADVVGCQFQVPNPKAWCTPTAFHTGLWRCKRKVLEKIEPPWFARVYDERHIRLRECDCLYFAKKALAAGFTVAHGGWAEHIDSHATTAYGTRYCELQGV